MKKIPHTYRKPINHSVDGPNIAGPVNDLDYLNADAGDVYTTPSMTPVTIPEDRLNGNGGAGSWTNLREQINPITGESLASLKTFSTPTADELAQANAPDYWMPTQSLLDSFAGMFYPTEDVPQDCQPDSEFVNTLPESIKGLFRNPKCKGVTAAGQSAQNVQQPMQKSNRNLFIGLAIGLAVVAIVGTVIIVNRKSKAA